MDKILQFIKTFPEGVTDEQMMIMNPEVPKIDLARHLNELIKKHSITVYKKGDTVYYKSVGTSSDDYESLVYNIVSQNGREGVWIKEIKDKTNMPHNLALKVLKNMESKRIIKSIKCMKTNRKIYVLYDLMPSDSVTGGFWFNDNDIDMDCVENLSKIVYSFVKKQTYTEDKDCILKYNSNVKLNDIFEFVKGLNILTVNFKEEDLKVLVDSLVYEDKLEILKSEDMDRYRAIV